MAFEKLVLVTRKTPLEELVERFNTVSQAKFYIEHSGGSFREYQEAHGRYHQSLDAFRAGVPPALKVHAIERSFLTTFQFGPGDLIATLGPDGLVVNTAKYLDGQPILAVNPDPERIDGILLPWDVPRALALLARLGTANSPPGTRTIRMAEASLNDGQVLRGVNDLFLGPRTHVSARYEISFGGRSEVQSSSGVIVSTGAGSTGWLQSIVRGAHAIAAGDAKSVKGTLTKTGSHPESPIDAACAACLLPWESEEMWFSVREPFVSRTSQATLVFGRIPAGGELVLTSHMPENGVISSDGIESDYLRFNSGSVARVRLSDRKARLIV